MKARHSNPGEFESILDASTEEAREPGLIPEGPWLLRNVGWSAQNGEAKDGTPQQIINFRYVAFEPMPEVDPEAIERGGFEGKTIFVRRYISEGRRGLTDGSVSRLLKFAGLHGIDTEGRSVREVLDAMKNTTILATVGSRSYENKDGETVTDNTAGDFASAA